MFYTLVSLAYLVIGFWRKVLLAELVTSNSCINKRIRSGGVYLNCCEKIYFGKMFLGVWMNEETRKIDGREQKMCVVVFVSPFEGKI